MAKGAHKRGLKYIAITDHSKGLGVANGLDEKRTRDQWKEIDKINHEYNGAFRILKSVEVEIRADGTLDQPDDLLAGYDLGAGNHAQRIKPIAKKSLNAY